MIAEAVSPVAIAARAGLKAYPKTLPPWLFYDDRGSTLFEEITELPEYYLTRTERSLFAAYAEEILLHLRSPVTVVELGAGTASKTGILLNAAVRLQEEVLYQPLDVSPSALEAARANIAERIPAVTVRSRVANYVTEPIRIERVAQHKVLALYIGSSIGNFSPVESKSILRNLRAQMCPGDALLLGTDLAPGIKKPVEALLAAYDDASGVTAAFNLNILARLNAELGADFNLSGFTHEARWNEEESRIEMHLVSSIHQSVRFPANSAGPAYVVDFAPAESIHTENSYKFTRESVTSLLFAAGYQPIRSFLDSDELFAVTLAEAV